MAHDTTKLMAFAASVLTTKDTAYDPAAGKFPGIIMIPDMSAGHVSNNHKPGPRKIEITTLEGAFLVLRRAMLTGKVPHLGTGEALVKPFVSAFDLKVMASTYDWLCKAGKLTLKQRAWQLSKTQPHKPGGLMFRHKEALTLMGYDVERLFKMTAEKTVPIVASMIGQTKDAVRLEGDIWLPRSLLHELTITEHGENGVVEMYTLACRIPHWLAVEKGLA